MTDQITVPRATWDAMREALEEYLNKDNVELQLNGIKSKAIEALTAANAVSEQARGGAALFWQGVYPDGWTAERVEAEMTDYHALLDGMPALIEHVTGGACSKPLTHKSVIKALHDDYVTRSIEEAVAEALEEAANPQATEPAPKKLIGWRTADYLRETDDPKMAKNWEVHYEILPIFEGDANTKLAAAPEAKQ